MAQIAPEEQELAQEPCSGSLSSLASDRVPAAAAPDLQDGRKRGERDVEVSVRVQRDAVLADGDRVVVGLAEDDHLVRRISEVDRDLDLGSSGLSRRPGAKPPPAWSIVMCSDDPLAPAIVIEFVFAVVAATRRVTAPKWISPAPATTSVPCEPATIWAVTAFVAASYEHAPGGGGGGGGGADGDPVLDRHRGRVEVGVVEGGVDPAPPLIWPSSSPSSEWTTSSPALRAKPSLPGPPVTLSAPSPALMLSLPGPPSIRSALLPLDAVVADAPRQGVGIGAPAERVVAFRAFEHDWAEEGGRRRWSLARSRRHCLRARRSPGGRPPATP